VVFFNQNVFIRGFLGDVIIVILMFFLLKAVHDFQPARLAASVFATALLVEVGQYIGVVGLLGIRENYLTKLILGSVFEYKDFLAYAIGVAFSWFVDAKILATPPELIPTVGS
jgi:hypothetical protein